MQKCSVHPKTGEMYEYLNDQYRFLKEISNKIKGFLKNNFEELRQICQTV